MCIYFLVYCLSYFTLKPCEVPWPAEFFPQFSDQSEGNLSNKINSALASIVSVSSISEFFMLTVDKRRFSHLKK